MILPKKSDPPPVHEWEHGWDEHERMQLRRLARLPLADKLAWLEEAHRLVMQLGKASSLPSENHALRKK